MPAARKQSGVSQYLFSIGILETGSPEDIAAAKRTYWKQYHYNHRKAQRKEQPEITVSLSRTDGTYTTITGAAKKHHLTPAAFLRTATLAYLSQSFVLPDRAVLAHLQQLLSQCTNEVQAIAGAKEKYFWHREQKIETMEARIEKLEREVVELLSNPPTLESQIVAVLKKSPQIRERLLQLITSHDCKD